SDVVVRPIRGLEREQVAHAAHDMDLSIRVRPANDRGVAGRDDPILAAPQNECRNIGERRDPIAERVADLLSAGDWKEQEPSPSRGLIRPHDRAHRTDPAKRMALASDKSTHERIVTPAAAADQEVTQIASAHVLRGTQQRAANERHAEKLRSEERRVGKECRGGRGTWYADE